MTVYSDNLKSIGRTPLIEVHRLTHGLGGRVLAKIEGRNPAYSVKCRIGAAMIWDAEERGLIAPGSHVVEATSGNTGLALAFACAVRGYHLTLTMPETMSVERRIMLRGYGAELLLTPGADGMRGAIALSEELARLPGWFMPRQFENPANPAIHFKTTGPEIWSDTEGHIDALVCGVGTGGTITGVGRFLRQQNAGTHIVAVEPAASPVLSGGAPGKHRIQGIGAGFVPAILDRSIIDEIIPVTDDEALAMTRRLMRDEGIAGGISCGAAMHAAVILAARPEFAARRIVVVLPDAAERYLSTALFDDLRNEGAPTTCCQPVLDLGDDD